MSTLNSWIVVLALALGTFLIRYSFIGLFAKRDMPTWLQHALQLMVPAIFAAIVAMGVFMHTGAWGGWLHWPRYGAALLALGVALATRGQVFYTVFSGMLALHLLQALQKML